MLLKEYIKSIEPFIINNGKEIEAVKKLLIELHYHSVANFLLSYNDEFPLFLEKEVNKYLLDGKPIEYILGYQYFYNLKLKVSENTLIPRKETEILVEEAIKRIKENNYKKVLDLCTGTGAIALSVKNEVKDITVKASDISKEALKIAKENSENYNLDIEFIESDIFDNIDYDCDIILSNPPYISHDEYVDKIVVDNEPHLALFADNDGLYFYEKIITESKKIKSLKMIIFEIGYRQANSIKQIAINNGYNFEVIKDYQGLDRIVILNAI